MIGLFIPDPDPNFTHPGSRGQKGTGSRIWIRNTGKKYVLLIYVDTKSWKYQNKIIIFWNFFESLLSKDPGTDL